MRRYRLELELTADELAVLRASLEHFLRLIGHPPGYAERNKRLLEMTDQAWSEAMKDCRLRYNGNWKENASAEQSNYHRPSRR